MSPTSAALDSCIDHVRRAPVRTDPFPHIIVEPFFPPDFYDELLRAFPRRSLFQKATYAGTGFSRRAPHYCDYGLALPDDRLTAPYAEVVAFMQSETFARSLMDKFAAPLADGMVPIPIEKRAAFAGGAVDFHSRAQMYIDLAGYEIPPHPDAPEKIVTYQLFLSDDQSRRSYGTHFLRPKDGRETVSHSSVARVSGVFAGAADVLGVWNSTPVRRLRQTDFALRVGLVSHTWYPWDWFETRAMAEAGPNLFMAFAPSPRTYHAVRLDMGPEHPKPERPVIRGFVRKGRTPFERITFHQPPAAADARKG